MDDFKSLTTFDLPPDIPMQIDTTKSFEEGFFRDTPVVLAMLILTYKNLQTLEYTHQMMDAYLLQNKK